MIYIKYGRFWSVLPGHFIKHKPLISEEYLCTQFLMGYNSQLSFCLCHFNNFFAEFTSHYYPLLAIVGPLSYGTLVRCVLSQQVLDTSTVNTSFLLEVVATWKSFVRWETEYYHTKNNRQVEKSCLSFFHSIPAAESICSNWWVQLQGKREWKLTCVRLLICPLQFHVSHVICSDFFIGLWI